MKKVLNILLKTAQYTLIALLLVLAAALFFSTATNPWGVRSFSVTSGSMSPALKVGSLVFTTRQSQYVPNDVITFMQSPNSKKLVTHRVVKAETLLAEDRIEYTTKGDANDEVDITAIDSSLVLGKVAFVIPLLGYVLMWAKTQMGYIALIVVPVTIIIHSELLNIKSEATNIVKSKKKVTSIAKE